MSIPITRAFLPPREELDALLSEVYTSGRLTNHGPLVQRLEEKLQRHMGVEHVVCVGNGTQALELALRANFVGDESEVVTTAFSYVATPAAIRWSGAMPVVADVDPRTLCLTPAAARAAITERTDAILPVHVYGNPCDTEGFEALSKETGIPVIYDAAHAFDGRLAGKGTASAFSFHATKMFHTCEGGAVTTNDPELADRVRALRNFGHLAENAFSGLGINAKMSEFHAAMGLAVLPHMPEIVTARGAAVVAYNEVLNSSASDAVVDTGHRMPGNVAYYPVLLRDDAEVLEVLTELREMGIGARRYFYPPLTRLPYVQRRPCPVAEDASERVLCLPLSHALVPDAARGIADQVLRIVRAHRKANPR